MKYIFYSISVSLLLPSYYLSYLFVQSFSSIDIHVLILHGFLSVVIAFGISYYAHYVHPQLHWILLIFIGLIYSFPIWSFLTVFLASKPGDDSPAYILMYLFYISIPALFLGLPIGLGINNFMNQKD